MQDNGSGIEKELLKRLNQGGGSKEQKQGYAIGNVRDRIQLYAGEAYGVWFDPEVECGTKVKIWFPYDFWGMKKMIKMMVVEDEVILRKGNLLRGEMGRARR